MPDDPATRFVVCRAGSRRFALPVGAVREVCTDVRVSRMPGVAAQVHGVANIRGTVITVVRAGDLLGVPDDAPEGATWLVVLHYRDGRVGLSVDEVEELAVLDPAVPPLVIEAELDPLFESGG